jgi:hypothetical protein
MDVSTSKRDPDLDLLASGAITVTIEGPKLIVKTAEDPGHHVAKEDGDQ